MRPIKNKVEVNSWHCLLSRQHKVCATAAKKITPRTMVSSQSSQRLPIFTLSAWANRATVFSDGFRRPLSISLMYVRSEPTRSASSSCDHPFSSRDCRRWFAKFLNARFSGPMRETVILCRLIVYGIIADISRRLTSNNAYCVSLIMCQYFFISEAFILAKQSPISQIQHRI